MFIHCSYIFPVDSCLVCPGGLCSYSVPWIPAATRFGGGFHCSTDLMNPFYQPHVSMNQIKLVDWKMKSCLTETHRCGLSAGYSKAVHCNMYGNPCVANATVWSQSVALDRSLSNQWGSGRLGLWRECWRTHSTIWFISFFGMYSVRFIWHCLC